MGEVGRESRPAVRDCGWRGASFPLLEGLTVGSQPGQDRKLAPGKGKDILLFIWVTMLKVSQLGEGLEAEKQPPPK